MYKHYIFITIILSLILLLPSTTASFSIDIYPDPISNIDILTGSTSYINITLTPHGDHRIIHLSPEIIPSTHEISVTYTPNDFLLDKQTTVLVTISTSVYLLPDLYSLYTNIYYSETSTESEHSETSYHHQIYASGTTYQQPPQTPDTQNTSNTPNTSENNTQPPQTPQPPQTNNTQFQPPTIPSNKLPILQTSIFLILLTTSLLSLLYYKRYKKRKRKMIDVSNDES